jgi:hypothetical protein
MESSVVDYVPDIQRVQAGINSKLYNSKFFLGSTGQPRPSTPEGVHTDATVRDYD